jgi:hypothetical protein
MGGMSGLSRRPFRARARHRHADDRGAALVEGAIITPLLLLLVFGVIEFGFLFKDSLTIANAARSGARVGSSSANDPLADYNVLKAIEPAQNLAHINAIVVFKAAGPNGTLPPGCDLGGQGGICNYYPASDLSVDQATFLSPGFTDSLSWPSSARQCSLSVPGGPDYIGVWISATHSSTVGLFPSKTLHDTTVMREEPCP